MTDSEIFNRVAIDHGYGARLDRARLAGTSAADFYATIAAHAEDLIADARRGLPRLPHVHFDFVYNPTVNAFSCRKGGRYFIGVTSGTFVLLQMVICRMLADSALLTFAGEASGESADLPTLTGFVPNAQRVLDAGMSILRPKTAARWQYSCFLLTQAVLFLVGHEIAHIACGHVDYWESKRHGQVFGEIGHAEADEIARIEKQSMEGQADERSLISRLSSLCNPLPGQCDVVPAWLSTPLTLEQRMFDCLFSVEVIFRMFGDKRLAGMDLADEDYPPIPLRRAMLRMFTLDAVKRFLGEALASTATAALRRSAIEIESAFARITNSSISVEGMNDALSLARP